MYLIGICGFAARPSVFPNAASSEVHNEVRVRTVPLQSVISACCLQRGEQLGASARTTRVEETSRLKCVREIQGDNGLHLCLSREIFSVEECRVRAVHGRQGGKRYEIQ